jgi:membrane protein DedA with SNARE-associated domain
MSLHPILAAAHVASWGYPAVFAFVAIESLGIPFPGETALIGAATYAGTSHHLNIAGVIVAASLGAIVGDNAGYTVGHRRGLSLARRYGRYVRLTERRLELGRHLFERHGGKVVFVGRFITGLRTWAAFLAGTMHMPWRRFFAFNVSGGVCWALAYGLGYYYLGHALTSASTGVDVALGVVGVAWIVAVMLLLRREERRLERRAAGLAREAPSG